LALRADLQGPLDPDHAVVAPSLDHLAVDRDDSEHVTHDLFVELETIAGHEGDTSDFAAMERVGRIKRVFAQVAE